MSEQLLNGTSARYIIIIIIIIIGYSAMKRWLTIAIKQIGLITDK